MKDWTIFTHLAVSFVDAYGPEESRELALRDAVLR